MQLPFEVVAWSSQKDDGRHAAVNLATGQPGSMWETAGPPEQWLVIDFGRQVEVVSVHLRCTGTQMDPKDLCVLRCGHRPDMEQLAARGRKGNASSGPRVSSRIPAPELEAGPWIIARRCIVEAGPQSRSDKSLHSVQLGGGRARFWKLVIKESWGPQRRVRLLAPLHMLCSAADREANTMQKKPSLSTLFNEVVNLSREEREMRMLARRHDIPLHFAEEVCREFRRYDTAGSGSLKYEQFAHVVRTITMQRAETPAAYSLLHENVPESRIRHLWQLVDRDGSGCICLEEFLVWFYRTFQATAESTKPSRHSERQADTGAERYYASLGTQRLRCMVLAAEQASSVP